MAEKKERKVKSCFTISQSTAEKLRKLSRESGVPQSQIVDKCIFGNTTTLKSFEKLCNILEKKEKGGGK